MRAWLLILVAALSACTQSSEPENPTLEVITHDTSYVREHPTFTKQIGMCLVTVRWVLPTEREDGSLLGADDLELFTLYLLNPIHDRITASDPYVLFKYDYVYEGDTVFYATVTGRNGLESAPNASQTYYCEGPA